MMRLATIIKQFKTTLMAQYATQLLPSHPKVLLDMKGCRSHQSLRMKVGCSQCDHAVTVIALIVRLMRASNGWNASFKNR